MSRCSTLALFSKSSWTTSMWPSFAAEINEVQLSCLQRQPVNTATPTELNSSRPNLNPSSTERPENRHSSTYQLIVPGAHEDTVERLKSQSNTCLLFVLSVCVSMSQKISVCQCVIAGYRYVRVLTA